MKVLLALIVLCGVSHAQSQPARRLLPKVVKLPAPGKPHQWVPQVTKVELPKPPAPPARKPTAVVAVVAGK